MAQNQHLAIEDDRRSRRTDVRVSALLDAGPNHSTVVTAHNVSAHGVMIETDMRCVPGRPLTIELPGVGRVQGRIAWVRDGHAGVAFNQPLTLDQLLAVV